MNTAPNCVTGQTVLTVLLLVVKQIPSQWAIRLKTSPKNQWRYSKELLLNIETNTPKTIYTFKFCYPFWSYIWWNKDGFASIQGKSHLLRKPGKHAKKLFPCMNFISSWLVDSINIHSSRNPAARFSLYYGDGSHIRAHLLFPWTFMSFVNVRRWKYGPIYFSWS